MEAISATRTSDEWIAALKKIGVPCGPINTIEEVFREPQVQHRGMKIELEHPVAGTIAGVANPIKFSRTPVAYGKAPPLLGEDTDRVLETILDRSKPEIQALRDRKVI